MEWKKWDLGRGLKSDLWGGLSGSANGNITTVWAPNFWPAGKAKLLEIVNERWSMIKISFWQQWWDCAGTALLIYVSCDTPSLGHPTTTSHFCSHCHYGHSVWNIGTEIFGPKYVHSRQLCILYTYGYIHIRFNNNRDMQKLFCHKTENVSISRFLRVILLSRKAFCAISYACIPACYNE